MMKTILIMVLVAACGPGSQSAGPDAGGALECSPSCGSGAVCVDTGHYEQRGNEWTWIAGPVSCAPACDANGSCGSGMTNLFDRSSTCYCVGR